MKIAWTCLFGLLLTLSLAAGPAPAQPKLPAASLGQTTVSLAGPEGLSRVDGLVPAADGYIRSLEPKFKLQVLALYAEPAEWRAFTQAAAAGQAAALPRLAMICTTQKMPQKSYDSSKIRQEYKKYDRWFSLAANNRVTTAILTAQGNKKLKEYMGVDLDFRFRADEFSKKFAETSNSISLGAPVSFNVFGQVSEVYLTVSALSVGDKLVYLAYFEHSGPPEHLRAIQAKKQAWRQRMSELNAGR